jgi:hypothetical protein
MTSFSDTKATDGAPTYRGRGDPAGRFAIQSPRLGIKRRVPRVPAVLEQRA